MTLPLSAPPQPAVPPQTPEAPPSKDAATKPRDLLRRWLDGLGALPGDAPPAQTSSRWVLAIIAVGFVVLGGWAFFAPLNRGVVAEGRVDPEGRRSVIRTRDGGTLDRVLVQEGQTVRAGQLLGVLDPRLAEVELATYQGRRYQLLIEMTVLEAELARRAVLAWPEDVRIAIGTDPRVAAWARVQDEAFRARMGARAAERAALLDQRRRLFERIRGLDATSSALNRQAQLMQEETRGLRALERDGYTPRNRVLAAERSLADMTGRIGENTSLIAQARVAVGEIDGQIAVLDARATETAAQRLSQLQAELSRIEDQIASQTLIVERTRVTAPTGGVVLSIPASGRGTMVAPNEPLFEIVPSDRLVVRAEVQPSDIERLSVGMRAQVRLSGLNVQTTPRLLGTVTHVSPDARVIQQTGRSIYEIRVEVGPEEWRRVGGQQLRPGMPAQVFVDGGARTAWSYLIEPVTKAYERSFKE